MPSNARLLLFAIVALATGAMALPATAASGMFIDDDESRYEGFIETAAHHGLVRGCDPPANRRFCPHRTVSRAELAVMIHRSGVLPPADGDHFTDDDGHPAEEAIEALAAAGVTSGCGDGIFCPNRILTRGELATLVAGALGWDTGDSHFPYHDLDESPFGNALGHFGRRGHLPACDAPVGRRMCPDAQVTRAEAAHALVSALELAPRTPTAPPAAPALDFSDDFETLALWDGRSPGSRNRVGLTDAGFRGRGLRVSIPRGSHYGADFRLPLQQVGDGPPERLYFRYLLRLDPDWSPRWSGKLPGFSGVYGRSGKGGHPSRPSAPGWSARVQFFGSRQGDDRARLGYYVYHLGQERRYGDSMMWNEAGKLRPGEWYCIEGEVKLNTPGIADGTLRAWVDGTEAFDAGGIEFRRPEEPDLRIESFWFNVYYGGKPTAEKSMGLTIDEAAVDTERVGCGTGDSLSLKTSGDITGNGFAERVWWGECPAGPCFRRQLTTAAGRLPAERLGDGAWFAVDAHRLGLAVGDVDGDGLDDVVYWGRCRRSVACWRVHRSAGSTLLAGEDWGSGARFASHARSIIAGDWNGDGLDDIAYWGVCGSDAHPCWRVHLSTGAGLAEPVDWGPPPPADALPGEAVDVNGDGRHDLVYPAPCGENTCWHAQLSAGDSFSPVVVLGPARATELEMGRWVDFDGDGRHDLASPVPGEGGWLVEVRHLTADGLGEGRVMGTFAGEVTDLLFRRSAGDKLEALVVEACEAGPCVNRRLVWEGELMEVSEYVRQLMLHRLEASPYQIS